MRKKNINDIFMRNLKNIDCSKVKKIAIYGTGKGANLIYDILNTEFHILPRGQAPLVNLSVPSGIWAKIN